jgi:cystathionine gamma-synthase
MGQVADPYRDIVPPIHVATTYERAGDLSYPGGRLYSRDQNPAYDAPQALLAQLEGGAEALLFASGMAASTAVLQALQPGDRILAARSMYWGWRAQISEFCAQWGIVLAWYDNADADDLRARLREAPTRLLWIETPANPTWEVTDLDAAVAAARAQGTLVLVDSTAGTPVLTRPIAHGVDLVMHSATKYLNGHSDVIAGALVTREATPFWERIRRTRTLGGAVLGPFEAWLLLRGMRTLFLRVRAASANALALAGFLQTQSQVVEVLYPGLPSHAGHAIACRQMAGGFGGMLSVRVVGGSEGARQVAARLQVFKRATSLGSTESLVEHRASVEGPDSPCPPDLLRLSVGIETIEDLIADFRQALMAPLER